MALADRVSLEQLSIASRHHARVARRGIGYLHIVFDDDGEAGETEEGRKLPKVGINNEPDRFRDGRTYALEITDVNRLKRRVDSHRIAILHQIREADRRL